MATCEDWKFIMTAGMVSVRKEFMELVKRMTGFCLMMVCLLSSSQAAEKKEPHRILFIGNSYTGVNQLPNIFKEIVASAGHAAPVIQASHPGGRTLEQHLSIPASTQKIDEGKWDVVILQGQSQEASLSEVKEGIQNSFLTSGKSLCEMIRKNSPAARIIWYQTWARHADYWKNPKSDLAIGKSPEEMMSRNQKWYGRLAKDNAGSMVARVGEAWAGYYRDHPGKDLHVADNSHPTFAGSYLAGLVLYQTIYQAPAAKITYRGSLSEEAVLDLQKAAAVVGKP
jgi:hypothetical protein